MTAPCPPHLFVPILGIHWETANYLGNRKDDGERLCVVVMPPEHEWECGAEFDAPWLYRLRSSAFSFYDPAKFRKKP